MTILSNVWTIVHAEMHYVYAMMRYLHARDGWDFVRLVANGMIALYIVARLLFSSIRQGEVVEWPVRVLRFVIVCTYLWLALRIWSGHYLTPVEPSEMVPNMLVALLVYVYRGDLREFWHTIRDAWQRLRVERLRRRAERKRRRADRRARRIFGSR